jgi:hypothetical protein
MRAERRDLVLVKSAPEQKSQDSRRNISPRDPYELLKVFESS